MKQKSSENSELFFDDMVWYDTLTAGNSNMDSIFSFYFLVFLFWVLDFPFPGLSSIFEVGKIVDIGANKYAHTFRELMQI